MQVYKILKLNSLIKNHRIKFLGLWVLSKFNKRYFSIQLDPVIACNLKCTMCYFSDPDFLRKSVKGQLSVDQLDQISDNFFANALRLQIGCGAEPTLYKNIDLLIKKAKAKKVPHISMVTNGNLLTEGRLSEYVKLGLDELILSLHGVHKSSYERFMVNGSYEKFINLLGYVSMIKEENPKLILRINYTFNEDNFDELFHFFEVFDSFKIDVIQLRPIDKIGESSYQNFSLKKIENKYISLYELFRKEASQRGINLIMPSSIMREESLSLKVKSKNDSSYLMPYTYCYISPELFWKTDFDINGQSFQEWKKSNKWDRQILSNVFKSKKTLFEINRNMINYEININ